MVILGVNFGVILAGERCFWVKNGVCRQSKAQHWGKSCEKLRIFSAIFCRILQTVVFFLQFSANFCSFLHPLARIVRSERFAQF